MNPRADSYNQMSNSIYQRWNEHVRMEPWVDGLRSARLSSRGSAGRDHGPVASGRTKKPAPQLPVYIGRKVRVNVKRACLNCDDKFIAETVYYRLCKPCRRRSNAFEFNE